jgi:hypothetical protein
MERDSMRRLWSLVLAALVGLSAQAAAQTLTPAQLQTLKTSVASASDVVTAAGGPACTNYVGQAINALANATDPNACVAAMYNLAASPDFWVWRTSVTKDELVGSVSVDGTTFSWTGTGYITRSQGERDAFNTMFSSAGIVNPSLSNVRQAWTDIFSGATAPAPANRTHLSTVSRRKAIRFERLYATGTGSTASPGTMVIEGQVSGQTIETARNLP